MGYNGGMNGKYTLSDSVKLMRTIRTSGTITPSGRALIRRMLAPVDFARARSIVELGPGNGCITRELLLRMAPEARLLCLEVDADFAARLGRLDDPRLSVHTACASELPAFLKATGAACADYVVSSLPLAILDDGKADAIIQAVRDSLCPEGRYLQYQYSLAHYGALKALFRQVRLKFTLFNMPPAFVYECAR